ncbi:hypothetical protein KEM52_006456 [Ascosphaera acerosa]|nr:hypothetical protein KEM52_006456 [Ascosphaera acerosa]
MAPTAEAAYAYFPSLGDCFTGDAQLASWDTIHLELLGVDAATSSEDRASTAFLLRLLEQPEPQAILRHALTPFAGPSASTDAAKSFESQLSTASRLTDAQKSRAGVDASEVKSDALWLSKACGLDELSALRVVALEWQQRPVSELLRRFSDEEVASLLDVVGGVGGAARPGESVYGQAHGHTRVAGLLQARRGDMQPTLSDGSDYSRKASPSAEETRRLRIWSTYLAERRGVLGVARRLMCVALRGVMPASVEGVVVENDNRREEEEEEGSCRHQLAKLARVIFNTSSNSPFSARGCTDALAARLKAIEDGSNYRSTETAPSTTSNSTSSNNDKAANPAIETAWLTSHLEETLQILQLLLLVLESSSELTAPDDLLAWLRLMADRNFLEGLCPATPQQASMYPLLQAYVAAVSLAFLKLAVAQRELGQVETEIALDVPEAWLRGPGVPFFLNGDHVAEIMELLSTAATAGVHTAGPAVIAWCVIMLVVHHLGVRAKEMRQEDGDILYKSPF